MSGKARAKPASDARVHNAVLLVLRCEGKLKVPEAMRACGFSAEDSADKNKQMWIHRAVKKATKASATQERTPPPLTQPPEVRDSAVVALATIPGSATLKTPPEQLIAAAASSGTTPSSISMASTSTTKSSASAMSKAIGLEPTRKTAKAKQKHRRNRRRIRNQLDKATDEAISWYAREQQRPVGEKRKSADEISRLVKKANHGIGPAGRTIRMYVNERGLTSGPALRAGNKGTIPPGVFITLCSALETYVKINQLNGKGGEATKKFLGQRMKMCLKKGKMSTIPYHTVERVLGEIALNMSNTGADKVEERRIRWTTYRNLKMWFDNWRIELQPLGFTYIDDAGEVQIKPEKYGDLMNLDETCISLDGSQGNRGGRPPVVFYDPRFPAPTLATSKSALTSTMIAGCTAKGEALPPHFQFQTKAKTEERERIRVEVAEFSPDVRGQFGFDEVTSMPASFGLNEKGGMDDTEFEKYLMTSIVPLWPNAKPVKGYWVIIKVDSGPGRLNSEMLARLRRLGSILYPGVPNTTAVTQETDRLYGHFKHVLRENLQILTTARMSKGKSTSLQPWMCGLVIFGGQDGESGLQITKNAFEEAFSRRRCRRAWEVVGACPITMACLSDPKVRRQLGDREDETADLMRDLQHANDLAVHKLNHFAYEGSAFAAELEEIPEDDGPVTVRHSAARVNVLASRTTISGKFAATGGHFLNSNDIFKSMEVEARKETVKELLKQRAERKKYAELEEKALQALARIDGDPRQLKAKELDTLLRWHGYKASEIKTKDTNYAVWLTIHIDGRAMTPPDNCRLPPWTDEDEAALEHLRTSEIDMADTALGRMNELKKRELKVAITTMTQAELEEIKLEIAEAENTDAALKGTAI